jgi:hypothetical protein
LYIQKINDISGFELDEEQAKEAINDGIYYYDDKTIQLVESVQ